MSTQTLKLPPFPAIYMPPDETEAVCEAYRKARVIGEYGSGGSTAFAATDCSARLRSVEADADWLEKMRLWLDENAPQWQARLTLVHCDIGPTARWSMPSDMGNWQKFWTYPQALWTDKDFAPDLVLIDGRFRMGCLAACLLNCQAPMVVMMDDYLVRPEYHAVEEVVGSPELIGRLARFELRPGAFDRDQILKMIPWFFNVL